MKNLETYCLDHSLKESKLLLKIKKFTFKNEEAPQMISGPIVGNILKILIKAINAKNILEVGMFTGYSALSMAEAAPHNGEIHTCEIIEKHVKTAQNFFNQSKYKKQITIHYGDANVTLEKFKTNSFDFVFIDADKMGYIDYYKKCMQLIKSGGIIVLDNMLWGGSVLKPQTEQATILNNLAQIIDKDSRNISTLMPIRDGLMVCYKL